MHSREAASAAPASHTGQMRWSLRLFGRFELSALPGGERAVLPAKRERVLLAYLALSPNCRQQRRKLATLLWGNAGDETALDNLRTCIWSLRKALGDTEHRAIVSDGEDIVLDASAFEVDAVAFRRLAAQSGRSELEEAANLYSGELLDGLDIDNDEFESWRRAEAARAKDQAVDVLLRVMTELGKCGETEAAIETGMRLLRLEPLHEPAVRRIMRLYGESGRRGPAVQLYRALADALKSELDAQPEAETRAVLAEVSRGSEEPAQALAGSAVPAVAEINAPTPSANAASTRETSHEVPPPAQQLAPAGGASRQVPRLHAKARRVQWSLAGGLAVAIAILLLYQFVPWSGTTAEKPAIAVLPFANLSTDPEQEFFSDGMTEEIITALTKVTDLHVVARTSASVIKGQNLDVEEIGRQLHATHLLEGSVRKERNRVRITAQLIQSDNGLNLWSGSYDRDLTDVFAIQEEIARAIAGSLRKPLGLKPGEKFVNNRSIDPESYQQYLRAKALVGARGQQRLAEASAILEQVVARNPNYAPAWALLGQSYHLRPNSVPERTAGPVEDYRKIVDTFLGKAATAANRAIQLDPNLADGYTVLAQGMGVRGHVLQAEELGESKIVPLDPDNGQSLHGHALALASMGYVKEAVAVRQRLLELEPTVQNFNTRAALALWLDGQNEAAISILKDLPPGRTDNLAMIYASLGRYSDAIAVIEQMPANFYPAGMREEAIRLLRMVPAKDPSVQKLPPLGVLSWVFLYAGAPERVLEVYERGIEAGYVAGAGNPELVWHPAYAPLRKTDRFKTFARKSGEVEYWRAKGWPPQCHPTTGDDFECN